METANPGQAGPHQRLFDHRVSTGEKAWRDLEPERPSGFSVENKLKCRRLLDGKVGGPLAPQQPIGIGCQSHIGGPLVGPIAGKTPHLAVLARAEHGWQAMRLRKLRNPHLVHPRGAAGEGGLAELERDLQAECSSIRLRPGIAGIWRTLRERGPRIGSVPTWRCRMGRLFYRSC